MTVASFCRQCGKALTDEEKAVAGTVLCSACAPAEPPPPQSAAQPAAARPASGPQAASAGSGSPGLAFLLGMIPGVGAIYNGQYAKGLIHIFVFGLLVSVADATHGDLTPVVMAMAVGWYFYMPFEAYHTARRKLLGQPVDELSSLAPLHTRAVTGPAILIVLGVLFLLHNLEILRLSQLTRFWPVSLIVLGLYMLYGRLTSPGESRPAKTEVSHEP